MSPTWSRSRPLAPCGRCGGSRAGWWSEMAMTGMAIASATRERPHGGGAGALLYRNFTQYRRGWLIFMTGFFEPVLFLFSIGIGVGALVGGFTLHGEHIAYADFVAPAMLATAAMNGAVLDSTFNVFF